MCVCVFIGMMIRPKGEALEIIYNVGETESWDTYIEALDYFLEREYKRTHLTKISTVGQSIR